MSYHPNAPKKLIRALRDAGSERALSRTLGVNIFFVSQLLRDGKEPTDRTEKGRATRVKLYLTKFRRKPRVSKVEEWTGQKIVQRSIRKMVKETKEVLNVYSR